MCLGLPSSRTQRIHLGTSPLASTNRATLESSICVEGEEEEDIATCANENCEKVFSLDNGQQKEFCTYGCNEASCTGINYYCNNECRQKHQQAPCNHRDSGESFDSMLFRHTPPVDLENLLKELEDAIKENVVRDRGATFSTWVDKFNAIVNSQMTREKVKKKLQLLAEKKKSKASSKKESSAGPTCRTLREEDTFSFPFLKAWKNFREGTQFVLSIGYCFKPQYPMACSEKDNTSLYSKVSHLSDAYIKTKVENYKHIHTNIRPVCTRTDNPCFKSQDYDPKSNVARNNATATKFLIRLLTGVLKLNLMAIICRGSPASMAITGKTFFESSLRNLVQDAKVADVKCITLAHPSFYWYNRHNVGQGEAGNVYATKLAATMFLTSCMTAAFVQSVFFPDAPCIFKEETEEFRLAKTFIPTQLITRTKEAFNHSINEARKLFGELHPIRTFHQLLAHSIEPHALLEIPTCKPKKGCMENFFRKLTRRRRLTGTPAMRHLAAVVPGTSLKVEASPLKKIRREEKRLAKQQQRIGSLTRSTNTCVLFDEPMERYHNAMHYARMMKGVHFHVTTFLLNVFTFMYQQLPKLKEAASEEAGTHISMSLSSKPQPPHESAMVLLKLQLWKDKEVTTEVEVVFKRFQQWKTCPDRITDANNAALSLKNILNGLQIVNHKDHQELVFAKSKNPKPIRLVVKLAHFDPVTKKPKYPGFAMGKTEGLFPENYCGKGGILSRIAFELAPPYFKDKEVSKMVYVSLKFTHALLSKSSAKWYNYHRFSDVRVWEGRHALMLLLDSVEGHTGNCKGRPYRMSLNGHVMKNPRQGLTGEVYDKIGGHFKMAKKTWAFWVKHKQLVPTCPTESTPSHFFGSTNIYDVLDHDLMDTSPDSIGTPSQSTATNTATTSITTTTSAASTTPTINTTSTTTTPTTASTQTEKEPSTQGIPMKNLTHALPVIANALNLISKSTAKVSATTTTTTTTSTAVPTLALKPLALLPLPTPPTTTTTTTTATAALSSKPTPTPPLTANDYTKPGIDLDRVRAAYAGFIPHRSFTTHT